MEWISLKDRFPDNDSDVLITDSIRMSVSWYDACCDFWRGGNIPSTKITNSMYLPNNLVS